MKKKDKTAITSKSDKELVKIIDDLSAEIRRMSVSRFSEQQKNTRTRREMRKKLAVVKTILHMRQLGGKV